MTGNPTLRPDTFTNAPALPGARTMTVQGAVNKTALLLAIAGGVGCFAWNSGPAAWGLAGVGALVGFVIALVTCFKVAWSPVLAPLYAACEGLVLGAVSAAMNRAYPGIALQATILTGATLCAMLGAYSTGVIRATEKFKMGVFAATAGIALLYLVSWIMSLFHVPMPLVHGNGVFSIGLSVVVVIIAALNLVIDFDLIERGAAAGAPKYMEWYSAFALLVTLVWLYFELLRLLSKLNSRN